MPPKRVADNPPPAASSSDEEVSDEEHDTVADRPNGADDDDEEASVEEDNSPALKNSTVPASPHKSDLASDSDSESTQPSPSAFTIKHLKPSPKPNISGSKRPSESESVQEAPSKKKNKGINDDGEVKKGNGAIQRLWSENDEIAILNGLSQFKTEKGVDPYANMGAFYEFIKKSLHVDVSKNQLMSKIRRMKKKYQTNLERGENGQGPVFSNSHDEKSFELSKKVWNENVKPRDREVLSSGGGVGVTLGLASQRKGQELRAKNPVRARNGGSEENFEVKSKKKSEMKNHEKREQKSEKVGEVDTAVKSEENFEVKNKRNDEVKNQENSEEKGKEVEELWTKYSFLSESLAVEGISDGVKVILKEQLGKIEKGKLEEVERKWKRLRQAELELFMQRMELVQEQVQFTLDSIK